MAAGDLGNTGVLRLSGFAQQAHIITQLRRFLLDLLQRSSRRMRRSGKQPQIPSGRLANDRPAIIRRMIKHPVIPIEGSKKRNSEFGVIAVLYDLRSTLDDFFLAAQTALPA